MRFPLNERIIIRDAAGHIAADLSIATDYRAFYVDGVAPFMSTIYWFGSPKNKGGYWMGFRRADGFRLEVAHLSNRYLPHGTLVETGQRAFKTGNTGTLTSGPHLHLQTFLPNGQRVDPELLPWDSPINQIDMAISKVVAAQKRKLEAIQSGLIASAFDPSTGETYIIKESKKIKRPVVEVLNTLFIPSIDKQTLDAIPNG